MFVAYSECAKVRQGVDSTIERGCVNERSAYETDIMGNEVSLINDCHFYMREKRPLETYLENLWWIRIMLLFSIKISADSITYGSTIQTASSPDCPPIP